jgi:MoxR-like ATPase
LARSDKKGKSREAILAEWGSRDLTAQYVEASDTFGIDHLVQQVVGILEAGRSVILRGATGVGKSAVVRAVAHHLAHHPLPVDDCRILQLTFRLKLARLKQPDEIGNAFSELIDTLAALRHPPIPAFTDGDIVASFVLGSVMAAAPIRLGRPVIFEASPAAVSSLMEDDSELEEDFVVVHVDEPDLETTRRIVLGWTGLSSGLKPIESGAVDEAVYLGQRFLVRSQFPKKAVDLLTQTSAVTSEPSVTREAVLERFCHVHRTPRWLVDPREPLDLGQLEARLHQELLGQTEGVESALSLMSMMKTGLSDLRRPFGVFMFVGPTGVGKTHLALILAETLFGSRDRLVRINLGDYSIDDGRKLFGDPDGYTLAQRRGYLTQAMLGYPFAVLLLDEFEKANPALFDRFLPLMDEGVFVNGASETISCRSMIIIATSNAGAEVYRGAGLGFLGEQDLSSKVRMVEQRIRDQFRFEFLNRFDGIVHFLPLSRADTRVIAERELDRMRQRPGLLRYDLQLRVDESVLDWLAVHGYHPDFGARFLKRTIERSATRALAEAIVRHHPRPGSKVELMVRANRIVARIEEPAAPKPARIEVEAKPGGGPRTLEPQAIASRARVLLDRLTDREADRSHLLERINTEGFWDGGEDRDAVLEQYRDLDVLVGIEKRLARPIEVFLEAMDQPDFAEQPNARAMMGQALSALERWEERESLEGPRRLWLVLSGVDLHRPPVNWMKSLVRTYVQFGRRNDLRIEAEAIEPHHNGVRRVVLEVEGSGAHHYLAGEAGQHRMRLAHRPDQVLRVDLVPRSGHHPASAVRECTKRDSGFGFAAAYEGQLEVPDLGITTSVLGREAPTLAQLVPDLAEAIRTWSPQPEVVRTYGEGGGNVRDPRTGALVPNRQVSKGRLEPFRDAYHRLRTTA